MATQGVLQWLTLLAVLSTLLFSSCMCEPHNSTLDVEFDAYDFPSDPSSHSLSTRQAKMQLRIMTVGASIVAGTASVPMDGFRKQLRTLLRFAGYPVNMVGSQRSETGSMYNGAHEGYPGLRILEIRDQLTQNGYLNRKPNIVIMYMGTNNCLQDRGVETGGTDIEDFANYIMSQSPGVAVIVGTLGRILFPTADQLCIGTLNPAIRNRVDAMQQQGKNIHLVEFGIPGYFTEEDTGPDGIHPTQKGYGKMAELFYDEIEKLFRKGYLAPAMQTEFPDVSEGGGSNCEKVAGQAYGPVESQFGKVGEDDGAYSHSANYWGSIKTSSGQDYIFENTYTFDLRKHYSFAQLVNPSGDRDRNHIQDELIFYSGGGDLYTQVVWNDNKVHAQVAVNLGNARFGAMLGFDVDDGPGCLVRGLRWGDVNNDGLDDYICIGPEGNMYVSLNKGGNPPQFQYLGLYKEVPPGYSQENVLLADIDGDGRLDYCATAGNGDISCWRNAGTFEDKPTFWQELGVIFEGKGMGDIAGTRFVDINGDHRSDWVWMYDTGKTRIFTNSRGRFQGLKPFWKEAVKSHAGTETSDARVTIKFAKLFARDDGSHADYVRVRYAEEHQVGRHYVEVYQNTGVGGTKMKADGNRYCDMTGSGRADLIWIRSTGEVRLWENLNKGGHLSNPWTWGADYQILNVNEDGGKRDRRGVHFVDWDGDGKGDVLYHDKLTGQVEWWKNTYAGGQVSLAYQGKIPNAVCNQGIGVGLFDLGLRFADIDGDKRADWLCMAGDGTTTGYLNEKNGLRDMGQIKKTEGHERANLRWADVNGDGRADLLFTDNLTGDVQVWTNEGEVPERISGSSFKWTPKGKEYDGQSRSGNQYYPDLDGDRRADLHHINPDTNTGVTWFNICPGGSGQDDPGATNPHEPPLPQCTQTCSDDEICDDDGGLDKRGSRPPVRVPGIPILVLVRLPDYPSIREYLRNTAAGAAHVLYRIVGPECEDTEIEGVSADDSNGNLQSPLPGAWRNRAEMDHGYDFQTMPMFLEFAVTGRRLNGRGQTTLQLIPQATLQNHWDNNNDLPITQTNPFGNVNDYVMDRYGSTTNYENFIPLRGDLNGIKGSIMGNVPPMQIENWERRVEAALAGDNDEYENMTNSLHRVFALFNFFAEPDVLRRINNNLRDIRAAWVTVEATVPGWVGVTALWDQFVDDQLHGAVQTGYDWALDALNVVSDRFGQDPNNPVNAQVLRLVSDLLAQLHNIVIPGKAIPDRRF